MVQHRSILVIVISLAFISIGARRGKTQYGDPNDSTATHVTGHADRATPDNTGLNEPGAAGSDEVSHAVAAMDAAQKKVEHAFEANAEWVEPATAFTKARNDYEAARATVTKALHDKPAYQAALANSQKADQALADARKSDSIKVEDRMATATAALEAHTALNKLETDACATDATVTAAKKTLAEATTVMNQMRQKEHAAVLADADWQAAKAHFDDGKAKTTAAGASSSSGGGSAAAAAK